MKTLKRIALLLKLKWEESKWILMPIITIVFAIGFTLLLVACLEIVIIWLLLGAVSLFVGIVAFVKWIYSNW